MITIMKFLFIVMMLINLAGLFGTYKLAKLCNLTDGFISFLFNLHSKQMKSLIANIWLFNEIEIPKNGEFWLLFSRITGVLNIVFIYAYWFVIMHNNIVILIIATIFYVVNIIIMYKQFNRWSK